MFFAILSTYFPVKTQKFESTLLEKKSHQTSCKLCEAKTISRSISKTL